MVMHLNGLLAVRRLIYIVDLRAKGIKHATLLDSCKGIIYDSAEEYPFCSTTESLRMCCGVGADASRVKSVRRISMPFFNFSQALSSTR